MLTFLPPELGVKYIYLHDVFRRSTPPSPQEHRMVSFAELVLGQNMNVPLARFMDRAMRHITYCALNDTPVSLQILPVIKGQPAMFDVMDNERMYQDRIVWARDTDFTLFRSEETLFTVEKPGWVEISGYGDEEEVQTSEDLKDEDRAVWVKASNGALKGESVGYEGIKYGRRLQRQQYNEVAHVQSLMCAAVTPLLSLQSYGHQTSNERPGSHPVYLRFKQRTRGGDTCHGTP
ncbi:hypothetical protein CC80DRAFT_504121 [Byssothecium circinans]|uniref:Uncharacterized protein n=1 Tax=Byssothecium circinans TaxID=147558 RepID=A0A6A5TY72_9PLEO|nr:hypothetical protein CC80DRAFT_504121 [Byssothecium circinans]